MNRLNRLQTLVSNFVKLRPSIQVPYINQGGEVATTASSFFSLPGATSMPHACEPGLPDMVGRCGFNPAGSPRLVPSLETKSL